MINKNDVIFYLLFNLLFFVVFYTVANELFQNQNYVHSDLLYFGEKALLALKGNPPRLENIGLVYPPFGFLPFLIYNDLVLIPSLVSASFSALLYMFFINICSNCTTNFVSLFIFLNPLYIYLATQKYEVLLFFITISLGIGSLLLYYKSYYTIYAFLTGMLTGISFMLDFRSIFLVPLYVIGIWLDKAFIQEYDKKLGIVLVIVSPILFFAMAWMYINFVFKGDPLFFISEKESLLGKISDSRSSYEIFIGLYTTTKFFYEKILILIPYIIVLFIIWKEGCSLGCNTILYFYLAPVVLLLTYSYFGFRIDYCFFSVLFLLVALVYSKAHLVSKIKNFDKILFIVFIISFISSYIIPIHSDEKNERSFVRFLWGYNIDQDLKFQNAKEVADIINIYDANNILCDDRTCYGVVYFTNDCSKFVLPYNYEFETYLSNPYLFADYILVNLKNPKDTLISKMPFLKSGFVPKFYKIYENEEYALYKRENQSL